MKCQSETEHFMGFSAGCLAFIVGYLGDIRAVGRAVNVLGLQLCARLSGSCSGL